MTKELVPCGYYTNASETPDHDPGIAGVPCPVCDEDLSREPRTTISLMPAGGTRSLFFRAHRSCWQRASEAERQRIESAITDAEARGPQ
jgi:hypothetical protein